jgi:hydroxymethylglutaryl-CoA reductase (NADPH)
MSRAEPIPRDRENDYSTEQAARRREFVEQKTGARLDTVGRFSIDPEVTRGNIENFIGTVQMPLGLAGPVRIEGEHARGDFYVPLATTEGTLVASYSRGMRVISECGGVRATVVKHSMQRAPVFLFADALQARQFGQWLKDEFEAIAAASWWRSNSIPWRTCSTRASASRRGTRPART